MGDIIYCCNTGTAKAVLFRGGRPVELSAVGDTNLEEDAKFPSDVKRVFGMFKEKVYFWGIGRKVTCLKSMEKELE